ncbi:MAG TPA: metallophosphoesterase [Sedimenticola sp.]|nr:metallophosphoesterase [Sedimenticola sp.]
MEMDITQRLERRLGRLHARQRLGIEQDHEAQVFGQGIGFFHLENWYSVHSFIRNSLRLAGLYGRGRRNALDIRVRHNHVNLPGLPEAFDGFTLLQLSDLHLDRHPDGEHAIIRSLMELDYDACVLTGDYRFRSFGPWEAALEGMERVRAHLKAPVYGVLGNHDSIRMVPGLEAMGIRMLLNESVTLERDGALIHLAGVDDAHFYRVDNMEKAAQQVPHDGISILLSHTPEIYRQAAHADFNLMLCGHTHGGQICLPGGYPVTLDARCPRHLGKGPWHHHNMMGYTSTGAGTAVVGVRLNCPPEITLHHLHAAQ